MRTCYADDCTSPARVKGLCTRHYSTLRRTGDPNTPPKRQRARTTPDVCTIDDCGRPHYAKGWCSKHYENNRHRGDPLAEGPGQGWKPKKYQGTCAREGCPREADGHRGYCLAHYARILKNGDPGPVEVRNKYGTGTVNSNGYREVRLDGRRRLEHRVVMEGIVGRPLHRREEVHHINGQRADNRPENLELWSTSQPAGQRVADKIAWALEFLAEYGTVSFEPHSKDGTA